jgi:hypothetical protein
LELDRFWDRRLGPERGAVPRANVRAILVIGRSIDPGGAWRLHRHVLENHAFDELLQVNCAAAAKNRLYSCLDPPLVHKNDIFTHLHYKWKALLNASYDVRLYGLTSTCFEGLAATPAQRLKVHTPGSHAPYRDRQTLRHPTQKRGNKGGKCESWANPNQIPHLCSFVFISG